MGVSDGKPQAGVAGRAPDHRPGIRETRPRAEPGLIVRALAERKQFARLAA